MPWPSKDPDDYQSGGAGWAANRPDRPRMPYRYTFAAALAGLAAGGLVGGLAGLDPFASAVLGGALSRLAVDVWWWRWGSRRAARD
jgi:hypothetical protein